MRDYLINYDLYHKKCDSIDSGIDYLRLSYSWNYYNFSIYNYLVKWDSEWYLSELDLDSDTYQNYSGIDSDNSNFSYISICDELLSAVSVRVKGGGDGIVFSCSYNGYSVPLFLYRDFHNHHIFDFYGSCFRLIEVNYLDNDYIYSVLKFFGFSDKSDFNISRIDYRIDFFMNTQCKVFHYNHLLKHNLNNSNCRTWHTWKILTNWQVWDKNNRGVVFRLYDKLLDSRKKWKDFLYFDYFRYQNVHRLEFECGIRFCKDYTFELLDKLLDKINCVFWINNQQRLGPIFHRYNTNKLVYTRDEIDRYMSYIKKNIKRLNFNYINSWLQEELNPLNIVLDYLWDINDSNYILSYETILNHSVYTWNRIRFFSKLTDYSIKKDTLS